MTLTELWKDGQLEDGFYYFRLPDGSIDIASEYRLIRYRLTKDADKIEVLAPVPSYEEWRQLIKFLEEFNALDVAKENQQLKELLKQWLHFYPIVLCEYEDTLKTKDIVELYEKTANAVGEKK